jgi:hypothetical protein
MQTSMAVMMSSMDACDMHDPAPAAALLQSSQASPGRAALTLVSKSVDSKHMVQALNLPGP